jgi:hypothetical protein
MLLKFSVLFLSLLIICCLGSSLFYFSCCCFFVFFFFFGYLIFTFSFRFCWASQHHGWVFCHCQSCDRNSEHWLMFDIDLHPLLGADEVSGDLMVGCQYHRCYCWRSVNMCVTIAVVQIAPQFLVSLLSLFPLFFRVRIPLFPVKLVCCWIWKFMTLCLGYLSVVFKYGEVLMKILLLLSISKAWGTSGPSKCYLSLLPFPSGLLWIS